MTIGVHLNPYLGDIPWFRGEVWSYSKLGMHALGENQIIVATEMMGSIMTKKSAQKAQKLK